jgi:hypothetical protein
MLAIRMFGKRSNSRCEISAANRSNGGFGAIVMLRNGDALKLSVVPPSPQSFEYSP